MAVITEGMTYVEAEIAAMEAFKGLTTYEEVVGSAFSALGVVIVEGMTYVESTIAMLL